MDFQFDTTADGRTMKLWFASEFAAEIVVPVAMSDDGPPMKSHATREFMALMAIWQQKGAKTTDAELAAAPLHPHDWHQEWNYTINAQPDPA